MNNSSKSKKVLITLFVIAGILGISALAVTYYLSTIKDFTPTDSSADTLDTSTLCGQVYVKAFPSQTFPADYPETMPTTEQLQEGEIIYPDPDQQRDLEQGEEVKFGLIIDKFDETKYNSKYTKFYFDVNGEIIEAELFSDDTEGLIGLSSEELQQIALDNSKVDSTNSNIIESIKILSVPSDKNTLSVVGFAEITNSTTNEVTKVPCGGLFSVAGDIVPIDPPVDDQCVALGQTGSTIGTGPTICCAGLTKTDNSTYDDTTKQCLAVQNEFVCIVPNDNSCGAGENQCNSSADCPATPEPGACIAEGGQGTHANAGQDQACCTGLTEASYFDNPTVQCVPTEDIFTCIKPNNGVCGAGENQCNSSADCANTPSTPESSSFTVSVTSTTTCVERVSPNDAMTYTITITNSDTDAEQVVSVKNKLPLGFTYTAGSSKVNGAAVSDTGLVTVTETGSSVDINWDPATNWSVDPGQSLVITFSAKAGSSALTGSQQNEVIVTPLNTPADPTALHVEYVFSVEQNCETPSTGIFDSTLARIITGLLIIGAAVAFYLSNSSRELSQELATSSAAKLSTRVKSSTKSAVRSFGLKLTNPRAHFEEKALKRKK